ncbi:NAD(P)/FAD-dependent oxidoreductase, partial [Aestuariivirga sp.]|uniref:NAD(P)/FAD-dependent oxidoreductase n=1 Tax=Aestuariivirga sp. TaxID=2650926 RepID=UPI0035AE6867
MAHIVVLGAGLGGTIMAYEMKEQLRPGDTLTVVTKEPKYHFVPSNPWIAVGWRKPADIEVDLAPVFAKKGIGFKAAAATKLHPESNTLDLADGTSLTYDYLINATGPDLAFDEIEGLGPEGHTQSICHVSHASKAAE